MSFMASESSRASLLLKYVLDEMDEAGDVVTYAQLCDIVGIEGFDPMEHYVPTAVSTTVDEVNKRLHRAGDWRHLVNVVRVGYRIASPADIREENLARQRMIERQHHKALRATQKAIIHPDATPAERKRAADAAAAQAAVLQATRKAFRSIRGAWPAEEQSPVVDGGGE